MILSGTNVQLFILPIPPLLPLRRKTSSFTTTQNFFFRSSSGVPVTRRSPSKCPEEGPLPVSRGPGHAYRFPTSLSSTFTTFIHLIRQKHENTSIDQRISKDWCKTGTTLKHNTSHNPLDPHKRSRIPVFLLLRFTFLELFA